jgi:hypothetical protein
MGCAANQAWNTARFTAPARRQCTKDAALKPMTPLMNDILRQLEDGFLDQGELYKRLGFARNVGVSLVAMHKRGLVECRVMGAHSRQ